MQTLIRGVGSRLWNPQEGAWQILQGTLAQQSLIKSFNHAFWIVTIMFAFTFFLVFFIEKPKKMEVIHDAH